MLGPAEIIILHFVAWELVLLAIHMGARGVWW